MTELDFITRDLTIKDPPDFKVISTFSGCGGSSTGYVWAGGKVLLAVEWDNNAVETYRLNYPDTDIYHGDIAKLTVQEVLERTGLEVGELDIFDGSPPCQGFSTAGKRNLDDDRNQLFREYVRLLRGLKPKVFVMENVSGMVKGKMKLLFAEILTELKHSGYKVSEKLLNAKYLGVPQSRQRLIFIGVRDDLGIEPSHPKPQTRPTTIKQAISELGNIQDVGIQHVWVDEWKRGTKWIIPASKLRQGQSLVPNVASSIRAFWDKPSPTLQKNAMPGQPPYVRNSTIHPLYDRTFSIREMARLHSYPDNFIYSDPLKNGMQRIGNSVPPEMMRYIAAHIKENILDKIPETS